MADNLNELITINAMSKPCPIPLLMLKKALKSNPDGHFLLKASDPHSLNDILRYCELNQVKCASKTISNEEFHYIIMK